MRIIVVDDEAIIAHTLVDILKGEGYDALAMTDGVSAVKSASAVEPDVVITDVIMPNLNGIEAAKQILKVCPRCRIIFLSGQTASADLLAKATAEGYDFQVLAKPVSPDRLLSILDPGRYSALPQSRA
jgi:CheY-like chemotaxis protein